MTVTYHAYRQSLARVRELPIRTAAELDEARQTQLQANSLADNATITAEALVAEAERAIKFQLGSARKVLEPFAKSNLIPPHIRSSGGPKTATRGDVAKAQQALAIAVNQLRDAAQVEIKRIEADNDRLAREVAERELAREAAAGAKAARARRRRLIQIAIATVVAAVVVVLILILTR